MTARAGLGASGQAGRRAMAGGTGPRPRTGAAATIGALRTGGPVRVPVYNDSTKKFMGP